METNEDKNIYKFKYKKKKVIMKYNTYNYDWYCIKINGTIVLCINNSFKNKSKLLHSILRNKDGGK